MPAVLFGLFVLPLLVGVVLISLSSDNASVASACGGRSYVTTNLLLLCLNSTYICWSYCRGCCGVNNLQLFKIIYHHHHHHHHHIVIIPVNLTSFLSNTFHNCAVLCSTPLLALYLQQ
jgi:hypothetical protein